MPSITVDQALQFALGHHRAGRGQEAEYWCRRILAIDPRHAGALNLLGILAAQVGGAGADDMAATLLKQAVHIAPEVPEYQSNLGNLLRTTGDHAGAIAAYRAALERLPDAAEIHSNLGCALARLNRFEEALASFHTALKLKPTLAEAHSNLAGTLVDLGRLDEAIAAYRTGIAVCPESAPAYAELQTNLGMALLLTGNFTEGWPAYEWRLKCPDRTPLRDFSQPPWNGEPLAGKTILLCAEQGLGDTIHFIRYARLLADRSARIIVCCQRELIPLLSQLQYVAQWISGTDPLPPFDFHAPLLSLPRLLGTTVKNIPLQDPPLAASPERAKQWRHRLATPNKSFIIGLAWAGSAGHKNDFRRSIPLALFAPLASVPGIRWISLQKGPTAAQADHAPFPLLDPADDLHNFADTGALIDTLDLVITVDTAIAHLAGAMNKPTWLLLPFSPDWRWQLHGEKSPWYPSLRLFRQTRISDWPGVLERVVTALNVQASTAH